MLLPHQDLVDQSMPFNSTHPTRGGTNAGTVKICPIGQTHAPNFLQSELTGVSRSLKKTMFTLVVRKQPEESRVDNCRRHQKCTKTENGRECMHFHHPLVHKSTAVEVGIV